MLKSIDEIKTPKDAGMYIFDIFAEEFTNGDYDFAQPYFSKGIKKAGATGYDNLDKEKLEIIYEHLLSVVADFHPEKVSNLKLKFKKAVEALSDN